MGLYDKGSSFLGGGQDYGDSVKYQISGQAAVQVRQWLVIDPIKYWEVK